MNALKLAAICFIASGVLGFSYGGFAYTTKFHELHISPNQREIAAQNKFNIPMWTGLGAVAVGLTTVA